MGMFDMLPFIGKSKERETIQLLHEQLALVFESACELERLFADFQVGSEAGVKARADSIDRLEKRTDVLRRQIEESLYSGAFLPMSRSRILDFSEKADDVADAIQDAAHMSKFIPKSRRIPQVDEALRDHLKETVDCVRHLKEAVDAIDDEAKIKALILAVEKEEHDVDLIEERIFKLLYEDEHPVNPLLLYSKLIEFAGEISNKAEEASDALSLVVLMHRS